MKIITVRLPKALVPEMGPSVVGRRLSKSDIVRGRLSRSSGRARDRMRRFHGIVCSDDVFTCREERIKDIVPLLTMIGGEIVHEREAVPPTVP
jgi:hypothetical protein